MLAAARPPAQPQTPAARRLVPGLGRLGLRTTPGRVRALAAVVVLAMAGFYVVANIAVGNARDGLRVIGHDAGPQVLATGDLYFALSDMDSQVADILLAGGGSRPATAQQARYSLDRARADRAALQAAELSAGDPTDQATVRSVLDGLGQYERLATQALDLDKQANRPAGPPTAAVIAVYRQATDLMKLQLLPQAYNLTLAGGATVREAYEAKRSAASSGRVWVALTGLAVLVALAGLQIYLVARFRRRVNFALVLATALLIVVGVSAVRLLAGEAKQLQLAKADGFDSILTLSRAQAISNSMHADEIRFLLDPGRSDTYSLDYLYKAQAILYDSAGNLGEFYTGLSSAMRAYQASSRSVTFFGFYGEEARAHPGPALTAVLTRFQQVQADDQRIRQLAGAGHGRQAIAVLTGQAAGASSYDFDRYDQAIVSLIGLHRETFDQAIRNGDHDLGRSILGSWAGLLPLAALGLAILVIAGVRPRLAEYR